jgi:hypothetical protein
MAFSTVPLDCSGIRKPHLGIIEQLARLRLLASRAGRELLLQNANDALVALIVLCGLSEVLRIEPRRKAEQRKEPSGVEKEGDLADPSVV